MLLDLLLQIVKVVNNGGLVPTYETLCNTSSLNFSFPFGICFSSVGFSCALREGGLPLPLCLGTGGSTSFPFYSH
jgi:hypothetical protein